MHRLDVELKEPRTVSKISVETKKELGDITVMTCENGRHRLHIGDESIEISDYTVKSSAGGEAELCVTIKGKMKMSGLLAEMKMETYKLIDA